MTAWVIWPGDSPAGRDFKGSGSDLDDDRDSELEADDRTYGPAMPISPLRFGEVLQDLTNPSETWQKLLLRSASNFSE
eukprot:228060-Rhodomonas_salina.1